MLANMVRIIFSLTLITLAAVNGDFHEDNPLHHRSGRKMRTASSSPKTVKIEQDDDVPQPKSDKKPSAHDNIKTATRDFPFKNVENTFFCEFDECILVKEFNIAENYTHDCYALYVGIVFDIVDSHSETRMEQHSFLPQASIYGNKLRSHQVHSRSNCQILKR
jgi:hypothetical protein